MIKDSAFTASKQISMITIHEGAILDPSSFYPFIANFTYCGKFDTNNTGNIEIVKSLASSVYVLNIYTNTSYANIPSTIFDVRDRCNYKGPPYSITRKTSNLECSEIDNECFKSDFILSFSMIPLFLVGA